MSTYYRGTTKNILTSCLTVGYWACTGTYSALCKQLRRLLTSLYPLIRNNTAHASRGKPSTCQKIPPTHCTIREESWGYQQTEGSIHQAMKKLNSLPALPPSFYCPLHTPTQQTVLLTSQNQLSTKTFKNSCTVTPT